jgi:hypothetical protein
MFGLLSEKFIAKLTEKITQSVESSLERYNKATNDKMDKVLYNVESLRVELKSLDERLTSKELKDHSEYGHVQYKLNSLQADLATEKKKAQTSTPDLSLKKIS